MKYALLIYGAEADWTAMSEQEQAELYAEHEAFGRALGEAGAMAGGAELGPIATATTVRVRDGRPLFTDGPFAETREQLGGFYLIEVDDLDQALQWAGRVPGIGQGCVEVRPVGLSED